MEESPLGLDLAQSRGLAGASEQQAALPTLSQLSILPCVSKGSHGVAQGPLWSLQWWWAVEKTVLELGLDKGVRTQTLESEPN